MKTALVLGAGGFIGSHMVKRLKDEGYWVKGADLKRPEFAATHADEFVIADLRNQVECEALFDTPKCFDEVYQFAADMGGAGYIFTGANDANVMHNSALINLHFAHLGKEKRYGRIFYSSSACIYPEYTQMDPDNPNCAEGAAYPAAPDSEYGWEKIFSERLYLAFARNHGVSVRIARFHNIFGPEGTWMGGKEKAPAAMCRKVAETKAPGSIEMWGDGKQTRSFLYINECIEGVRRLMQHETFEGPVNIGSDEMVTLNELASLVMQAAGKELSVNHIQGPLGVRGRNSDNRFIHEQLGWAPSQSLREGVVATYAWVDAQVASLGS